MNRCFVFTFFLIFKLLNANAQWTSDTTTNTVIRDSAVAIIPLVSPGPNGSTYISWFEKNGANFDLHMQLLDSNGYKLWSPAGKIVSNYPQDSILYKYDLKTDYEGNAIVAFQDIRSGLLNVVAYKIDINGNSLWGTGLPLIDSSAQKGIQPSIGFTGQNEIFISWSADSASKKWIAAQRISSSGTILWSNTYRIKDTVTNQNYSHVELFPSGSDDMQFLFFEENGSFPMQTFTLFTQRVHQSGNNFWPAAIKVSTLALPPFQKFPRPVPDDNGGFYIAFNAKNPADTSLLNVYVQNVDYNGILWSATGVEASNSPSTNKLAISSYYVSFTSEFWVSLQILDSAQLVSGVSVQKFDSFGDELFGDEALIVFPADTIYFKPNSITFTNDGMILTVTNGKAGLEHIKAIKLDNNGIPVWSNTSVSLNATNSKKEYVQSGKFVNNNLVIVWQDDRNGSGIFAQNITGEGNLGIVSDISEIKNKNTVHFSPNPSNNPQLIFASPTNSINRIYINNILGEELISLTIPVASITFSLNQLENLSNGIYLVSLSNQNEKKIFKWVKQ